jgi:3D (Asp-Asp-Asp) domain-containing protein
VLGQAHTPNRRLLPILLLALGVLVAPAVGGAGSSPSQASLRAQDARIVGEARASTLALYSLDQRRAAAQVRLEGLEAQAHTLRTERSELRQALRVARSSTRIAAAHLADHLRALYEQGEVGPLEIVFGATSLEEALDGLDSLSRASAQGEDVLDQLNAAKTHLHAATGELAARSAALATALADARATARSLDAARATRSAYLASLASQRQLTEEQLAMLESEVHAADIRTAALVPPAVADTSDTPQLAAVAPADGRTITVVATGYALGGTTATGLTVGWGVAAVDPSVIPLGTHLTVPGYGEAVAADTGGAIVGATIDLWFPTTAQAMAWGRRVVTISLH